MLKLKLLRYQKLVNRELKIFIRKYLDSYVSDWNKKFNKEIGSFLLNGGKRLRPILAIIIYEGTGGKDLDSFAKLFSSRQLHNQIFSEDRVCW